MSRGKVQKPFDAITTTNAYQYEIVEVLNYVRAGIWIKNTGGANGLTYIVHGSYSVTDSDASWVEEVTAANLAYGVAVELDPITVPFARLRIGIKSQTTDNHTTVDCFCVKKRY